MAIFKRRTILASTMLASIGTLGIVATMGQADPVHAQAPAVTAPANLPADDCSRLVSIKRPGMTIDIAKTQPANAPVAGVRMPDMMGTPNAGPPISGLTRFCRVAGRFHPEAGSEIHFEVWLPSDNWNGRFTGSGNGGFAGSLSYLEISRAVQAGQVGATTDTGHQGGMMDSAWAKESQARQRDYGWRAIHLTAVAAKNLAHAFYGREPHRSYFMSCSNGGRQALMEASRFPEDYDGIIAGAPAWSFPNLMTSMANTAQAQLPDGARIRLSQLDLLQSEVLRQCDANDGQTDGLVDDPRKCKVDLAPLACGASSSKECFSPAQITALGRITGGVKDQNGRTVALGYPLTGGEVGIPKYFSWETWIAGIPGRGSSHYLFAQAFLRDFLEGKLGTPETLDIATGGPKADALMGPYLKPGADLRRYFARGGKLIIYHGWSDPAIPAQFTLDYYAEAQRLSGARAKDQMRLFMVPGMQHCFGGPGANQFGQLYAAPQAALPEHNIAAALQAWVERDRTPETLIGERGVGEMGPKQTGPAKERLLCAWPKHAVLHPGADPDRAASYSCQSA
jgi:feruloyl esterase